MKAKMLGSLYKLRYRPGSRALGWRLSSSWGRSRQPDEPENETSGANKDSKSADDGFPYELSEREKRWQQRMDDIKKWIDQDPYEAMFGWSNRLRRGERVNDWPFANMSSWLREERDALKEELKNEAESTVKATEAKNEKAQTTAKETAKAEDSKPTASTSQETKTDAQAAPTSTAPPEPQPTRRIFILRSIDEPPLEYDPISNRMIRKGNNAFSHYAQELDVAEADAKAKKAPVFPKKVPIQVVEATPKPSKTASEPKDSSKGSLTPYKSLTSSNARAEYEAYKADRLKALENIKKQIQDAKAELDAFEKESPLYKSEQPRPTEKAEYRAKLENGFNKVQSEQDILERDLPSLTPYKMQRSRGTTVQPRTDATAAESGSDSPQLHPNFKPVHNHRNVLLMQLDDIDSQDKRLQAQIAKMEQTIDPSDKNIDELEAKLEGLWMKRRSLERQRADLNRQLRDLRWSEKPLNQNTSGPPDPSDVSTARTQQDRQPQHQIQSTSPAATNLETALNRHNSLNVDVQKGLQTALQRHSKDTAVLSEPQQSTDQGEIPIRQHVPYGYDHGRESAKLKQLGTYPPLGVLGEGLITKNESAAKSTQPSKAESVIERLYRTDIIDKLKNLVHRISDPVEPKQLTPEELRKQQQQEAANKMLDEEVERQKLAMQKMEFRKAPAASECSYPKPSHGHESMAKSELPLFSYDTVPGTDAPLEGPYLNQESEPQPLLGPDSITYHPAPLPDLDFIQKRAAMDVAKKEQKAKDAQLVREIRNIYEKEYGLITTKHRQMKEVDQEAVQEEMLAETKELPKDEPLTTFSLAIAPKMTETAQESSATKVPELHPVQASESTPSEPAPTPAPESLTSISRAPAQAPSSAPAENTTPVESRSPPPPEPPAPKPETTSFVILAYDHTTSSVTRATVSAPPTSIETPLPLTVALTQLTHPAKFLPHLQSLKHQGFVPVSCSNSLLILRRIGPPEQIVEQIEKGKATKGLEEFVNPVDKTAAPGLGKHHVPTGDFASPTGFVNYNFHDDLGSAKRYDDVDAWGYRRVPKRVERVFSGSNNRGKNSGGNGGNGGVKSGKVHKNWHGQRKERRRRFKRSIKNVVAVFGVSVAVLYVAGVVAEMRREMRKVTPPVVVRGGGEEKRQPYWSKE